MFFRKKALLALLPVLASCSAVSPVQSESDQENGEGTLAAELGERIEDCAGCFWEADSVSVSGDAVTVMGSFGITKIPADLFYVFADYLYHVVYQSDKTYVSYETIKGTDFYWLPEGSEGDPVTLNGDAAISFPVDSDFVDLLKSAESVRLRVSLGIVGEGSDMPTQLVIGRDDISFIS